MDGGCCHVFFLLLITVFVGFLVGVYFAGEFQIHGLGSLWHKFVDLFKSKQPSGSVTDPAPNLL